MLNSQFNDGCQCAPLRISGKELNPKQICLWHLNQHMHIKCANHLGALKTSDSQDF